VSCKSRLGKHVNIPRDGLVRVWHKRLVAACVLAIRGASPYVPTPPDPSNQGGIAAGHHPLGMTSFAGRAVSAALNSEKVCDT